MGEDVRAAIYYIFVISVILVLVAYYAGTTNVASTLGQQAVNLIYAGTGRTQGGTFAAYPK